MLLFGEKIDNLSIEQATMYVSSFYFFKSKALFQLLSVLFLPRVASQSHYTLRNLIHYPNLSSGARVFHITSNLVISRRCQDENGKEMYQNVKRTCEACRAIVFAH